MPPREKALEAYFVPASATARTDDLGLNQFQSNLEELLKQSIRDEERLEIEKLLKEIAEIKEDGQLPLNDLPPVNSRQKSEEAKTVPK